MNSKNSLFIDNVKLFSFANIQNFHFILNNKIATKTYKIKVFTSYLLAIVSEIIFNPFSIKVY